MQILILVHFIPSIWEHFVPPPVSPNEPGHYYGDTKKVQQALSSATALRRFIEDEETVAQVMEIFTGLYTLDMNAEGDVTHSNEDGETAFQAACLFDRSLPGVWEPSEEAHVQRQCVYGTT